jgi:hypothetical protein
MEDCIGVSGLRTVFLLGPSGGLGGHLHPYHEALRIKIEIRWARRIVSAHSSATGDSALSRYHTP